MATRISRDDVKKLAALARIKISPDEEENLAKDMENILAYVTQIQEFSATASEKSAASGTAKSADGRREKARVRNVLRPDENPHEPSAFTEEILAEAPKRQGEYVKVKKIL
jgi:aspartyl-tRNA(Asn)/glutamyl-tRNA(Gln) amidotransferase subunit C